MDNRQVIDMLLELARGVEFLDDNPFKARAYRKAAFSIESLDRSVEDLVASGEINDVDGVGKAIASKLEAWVEHGDFSALEKVRSRLPQGLDELEKVPGLGMKRIRALFQDHGISTVDELLESLEAGTLEGSRGFSSKTLARLLESVRQVISYRGKYLMNSTLLYAGEVMTCLDHAGIRSFLTGECRRGREIYTHIDLLVESFPGWENSLQNALDTRLTWKTETEMLTASFPGKPPVRFHPSSREQIPCALFLTTGSEEHASQMRDIADRSGYEIRKEGIFHEGMRVRMSDEREIYTQLGMQFLPPEVREGREVEILLAQQARVPRLITEEDLRGIVHVHTLFSDGRSSLEDMVRAVRSRGFSWIGISDHSQSAYYAGGMSLERLKEQFAEIERCEESIPEIKILRGIESDIHPDGSLDYPDEILAMFDFVIASVHSQMEMDETAMTGRIVRAIRNPRTSILAHPTGRLLLSREQYRVDMNTILEEAIRHSVAIELNANPWRLDLDWRLIYGFISSGGRIIIGPDAHSVDGLDDITYGVIMARKGFTSPEACLNTRDETEIREALSRTWK